MSILTRINPNERGRFFLLALLLFFNSMILESNEVVATSGFISSIGVSQILLVWAIDMTIVIVTSGIYSLFVDNTDRRRLVISLYFGFSIIYLLLYGFFNVGAGSMIGYGVLLVINDQQWLLFPLVIWALANDMFNISEAKRLFPILGSAAFIGGMVGNGLAAATAQIVTTNYTLLLFNAVLILGGGALLFFALRRIALTTKRSRSAEKVSEVLQEGLGFIREVPIFRYLTFAMILLGIGLNAIEFEFLRSVFSTYSDPGQLQTFYGTFKIAVAIGLLIIQGFVATWLLNRLGFKYIFVILPVIMLSGLIAALMWPGLLGIVLGNYLVRVSKNGLDDPSIKAFQGLVPDERRGRVSAFMDGYLYPIGSIIGCVIVGSMLILNAAHVIDEATARILYLSAAIISAGLAVYLASRIHLHYDASMLNWRLKRRKRSSALADIEL
ncbi:MAG: Npt1/Npt2 family nucleotide transporter [Candidatus Flexifilum sp.]|jgi:ATP/ADP translocase|nr:MAG: hypothetical protein CUN53_00030 [Phototrophicales bacterium]